MTTDRAHEMTTTDSGVPVRLLPTERRPKEDCLTLTTHELAWLNEFRKRILLQFPTSVADIIVYGFRTRGLADEDLDMDIMVITSDEHAEDGEKIFDLGYDVSLETGAYPAMRTKTQSEWDEGKRKRNFYRRQEIEEGISVL